MGGQDGGEKHMEFSVLLPHPTPTLLTSPLQHPPSTSDWAQVGGENDLGEVGRILTPIPGPTGITLAAWICTHENVAGTKQRVRGIISSYSELHPFLVLPHPGYNTGNPSCLFHCKLGLNPQCVSKVGSA